MSQDATRIHVAHCWWRIAAGLVLALVCGTAAAGSLQQRYENLRPKLAKSPFGVPLHMESSEAEGRFAGEVFAVVSHPFPTIAAALRSPSSWCEIFILHLNVTGCIAGPADESGASLHAEFGRKGSETGDEATGIDFRFVLAESSPRQFNVRLVADRGPLGTRDYLLEFEAAPAQSARSLVRLAYAYTYGASARLAMNTYLQTIGRDKIGFTVTGHGANGVPVYVDGLRGVLERNTMRYYLAVDTFLASLGQPKAERRSWRFNAWFDATERYRHQLHELSKEEYLDSKQAERPFRLSESTDTQ